MPKLTKTAVDKSEPKEKQYTVWCSDLKGFGVAINPAGSKSYIVDYRTADGARRRMTIGRHGAITADEARKIAITTLGDTIRGDDPILERKTRRKSLAVAELCNDYITAASKGLIIGRGGRPKKLSTVATDKSAVDAHIIPLLGKKLVIDLTRADIVKFIRDVTAGKTAKDIAPSGKLRGRIRISGGAGIATRTAATLGAILSYAVSEGAIESNPTYGVKKPVIGRRERRLRPEEYAAFGRALRDAEAKAWQGAAALRLAALTGCRIGEIENLKWSEVDLTNSLLTLEDSKTGKSVRPLGVPAAKLLKSLSRTSNYKFVFPSDRLEDRAYAGIKRYYRGIFKSAGFYDVTPHVLRHSFASVGADLGFSDSTIGAMLGHSGSGITSRYTHRLDSVLIAAADKIAEEIERQMGTPTN
ncbi:tyrosine-type recombinase/integrase [Pseudochrobactrum sp. sp1633]|uniref:tyrosine-type recombinase/integrase n=1 Tax=Pseudochrobactrum sp. sp1633 TaxID=3036706 RepID=UPI0025A62C67|nr:site-specific integrase [Pseudochrobactrum sp. sp1633]MDM8346048.1 tyrosine-type recombinase/integrase [Pseudochrobactrum sp. sp1633]